MWRDAVHDCGSVAETPNLVVIVAYRIRLVHAQTVPRSAPESHLNPANVRPSTSSISHCAPVHGHGHCDGALVAAHSHDAAGHAGGGHLAHVRPQLSAAEHKRQHAAHLAQAHTVPAGAATRGCQRNGKLRGPPLRVLVAALLRVTAWGQRGGELSVKWSSAE